MSTATEITVQQQEGFSIIDIVGNLDLQCAYKLKEVVTRVAGGSTDGVVIDLSAVPYLDSSGIGVLVYANSLYRSNETTLRITGVHGSPRQVLELTKLTGFLPLSDSVATALEEMKPG
jgi:anti-sigma B factor antagonist